MLKPDPSVWWDLKVWLARRLVCHEGRVLVMGLGHMLSLHPGHLQTMKLASVGTSSISNLMSDSPPMLKSKRLALKLPDP